jgi:hypothetical protein
VLPFIIVNSCSKIVVYCWPLCLYFLLSFDSQHRVLVVMVLPAFFDTGWFCWTLWANWWGLFALPAFNKKGLFFETCPFDCFALLPDSNFLRFTASKYKIRHKVGFEDFWCLAELLKKVKEVKIDDAGHETDDIGLIQTLTSSLAEMNEASLAFWLLVCWGGS